MDLKTYYKSTGKSMDACGAELGVNASVFRSWLIGTKIPRRNFMLKIFEWSGGQVRPDDFYLQEEEHKN